MPIKEKAVQTTVRIDPESLREAQYYWSLEGISLSKFVAQKVEDYLKDYRKAHPERVPGGVHATRRSRES